MNPGNKLYLGFCRTLTEQNKVLTVRNAHLEAEVVGEGRNKRLHELEQAMADVKAENARLQVHMHVKTMYAMILVKCRKLPEILLHRHVSECKLLPAQLLT